MKKSALLLAAVAVWVISGSAFAAGDAAAGKTKAASCGACHGPDGNSTNPIWPNLAGQHAAYLVKQLNAFKSGERKDPLMSPMAAGLSVKDMEDLGAFYESQKQK